MPAPTTLDLTKKLTILSFDMGTRHFASWMGYWDPDNQKLEEMDWRCDDIMPDIPSSKTVTIEFCTDRLTKFVMSGTSYDHKSCDNEESINKWPGPPWGLSKADMVYRTDSEHKNADEDGEIPDSIVLNGNPDVDVILIEQQDNRNFKTKCLSHVLQTLCNLHFPCAAVYFVSASLKNKYFENNVPTDEESKHYAGNKKGAVDYVEKVMGRTFPVADKDDDLADCLLQAHAVVDRVFRAQQEKARKQAERIAAREAVKAAKLKEKEELRRQKAEAKAKAKAEAAEAKAKAKAAKAKAKAKAKNTKTKAAKRKSETKSESKTNSKGSKKTKKSKKWQRER